MRRRQFIAFIGTTAAAFPLAVRAQKLNPVIGFLNVRAPSDTAHLMPSFHKGLAEGGYVEGRNVAIEYRWAEGRYSRLPTLVDELVRRQSRVRT